MKKRILYKILILLITAATAGDHAGYAQEKNNCWYFGDNAGLLFSGSSVAADMNGKINAPEGSYVQCDEDGNLLFYSDGQNVWNKNHTLMNNGTGILGGPSCTQAALAVKKPNSSRIYYLFTSANQGSADGIRYSEIDMLLNNGLGDVTVKNILLTTPSCEKLAATMHENGTDVWVLTHDYNSDAFRAYLVTGAGVTKNAVISNAGISAATGGSGAAIGQMKFSPNGKKVASARHTPADIQELFDFDNEKGIVSHALRLKVPVSCYTSYGIEFSPKGTKLYATKSNPGQIYQFDLSAGSDSAVVNSGVVIGGTSGTWFGSLQSGPNNKIYAARPGSSWLGVINNPEAAGTACSYSDNGVYLAGRICELGLPGTVSGAKKISIPSISFSANCLNASFHSPALRSLQKCNGAPITAAVYSWNFGDPSSSDDFSAEADPSHVYSDTGTYKVMLTLNYPANSCGPDTFKQLIHFSKPGLNIVTVDAGCYYDDGKATANVTNAFGLIIYNWSNGETGPVAAGLPAGSLTLTVSDTTGCSVSQNIIIAKKKLFDAVLTGRSRVCSGDTAALSVSGGNEYSWSTGEIGSKIIVRPAASTSYTVIASNGMCLDTVVWSMEVIEKEKLNIELNYLQGNEVSLKAISAGNCSWFPAENLSCSTCENTRGIFAENSEICARRINDQGCADTSCAKIIVNVFYIPNAFTPDENSVNDVYKPVLNDVNNYHFMIFDRWGEKLFETADPSYGWDGSAKGRACAQDVYVYKISYLDQSQNKPHEYTGSLTLLR